LSGFIPEDIINRIRDSIDIVELVSRYLSLKKTGANYKALCPFHKEKTPSFVVSPTRQTFHCFGCGKGGNVFHFVMEMDRLPFPEAVRMLGRDAGIEVPERRLSPGAARARDERAPLYEANRRAAEFYARMLETDAAAPVREYVRSRGISDEMVERCQLGYAPDAWDELLRAAESAGVSSELLARAGLALERKTGTGYYDRFRNRLMFPIFDTKDRVIGFGARALGEAEEVKYLNSPETPVFSKGRNVYGLNWARVPIVNTKRAAVVEGYTDVIMAHQCGVENVVATLGTALTRDHIRLLRRFAERIDVVFDADAAGRRAAERSMELFLDAGAGDWVEAGFDVRIATIPGGKDPCELIADAGPEAFTAVVDAAPDVFTKKIELAAERHDLSSIDGKTKVVDEVLELATRIPNSVGRQLHVDAAVRRLSDRLGLDERVLRARLAQIERRRRPRGPRVEGPAVRTVRYDPAERGVLEALVGAGEMAGEILDQLTPADFGDERLARLFEEAGRMYGEDGAVSGTRLLSAVSDAEAAALLSAMLDGAARPDLEQAGRDCLRALLRRRSERKVREIRKELEKAKQAGDEKRTDDLTTQYLKLQREVLTL
jgi:DNA primase